MPDLLEPQFVSKRALYDENGAFVACVVARKTVELYFLGNQEWRTPRWRLEALKKLHEDMNGKLRTLGFTDGHVWLPPQVGKSFGKRLIKIFGWQANDWRCLSRKVG